MDEDIFEQGFSEEILAGFRLSLSEAERQANDEALALMLTETLTEMTPEEAEGFLNTLKKIGKAALPTVSKVGQAVLPVAGAAVGSAIAPGVGTALGGALGNVAGQALAGVNQKVSSRSRPTASRRPRPSAPRPRRKPKAQPRMSAPPSVAASQLLQLLQSPQLLQALSSLILGPRGKRAIAVGSRENYASASPGAFLNLLESLASQAAVEAAQMESTAALPSYLEGDGEAHDVANPDERASILMEWLQQDETFLRGTDVEGEADEVTNWLAEAGLVEATPY